MLLLHNCKCFNLLNVQVWVFQILTLLEELLIVEHLQVTTITMRKDVDRLFKGSVFVEFASVDEAKAFVGQESLKYNEEELIKMTK